MNEHGSRASVLIVAATPRELEGAHGYDCVETLCCGVGPDNARRALAGFVRALAGTHATPAVLHVGIAGARRGSGVPILSTVIGARATDCDGSGASVAADPELLARARRALPDARVLDIGTSAKVGGTRDVPVEAMEGYAVLDVCRARSVPAIEVRVISNEVEEEDRSKWRFDDAFTELGRVTRVLIGALTRTS